MSVNLIARNVSRRYGPATVVNGVSLDLEPGKITALLGGSGAGKSTLLRLLAGLEPLDEGEICLGDQMLSAPGKTVPAEKRRIGLIFQDFALFPHLTAAQNDAFGLKSRGKEAARTIAAEWLARLGLTGRADAYPHELSGGEQQRVAMARALAPEPAILIADEPTGNLDQETGRQIADLLFAEQQRRQMTLVLVTHDPALAHRCGREIAVRSGVIYDDRDAPGALTEAQLASAAG